MAIERLQIALVRSASSLGVAGAQEIFGIEGFKLLRHKEPVFSHQLSVEIDFAPSILRPLDADEVPVNLASISIVGLFVCLTRCEVERSGNFLVEERVAHRRLDVRIEANREFSYIASSLIGIEYRVEPRSIIRRCVDYLAISKFKPNRVESRALINAWRIELDHTFCRISDRSGENLAIRNVMIAPADNGRDILDAESEIGSRPFNMDLVSPFHQLFQRIHSGLKPLIIQCADFKKKVLECLSAHFGQLGHCRSRPAQDNPFSLVDAMINNRLH